MIRSLLLAVAILGLGAAGGAAAYHFMGPAEEASAKSDETGVEDGDNKNTEQPEPAEVARDKSPFNLVGIWAPEGEYCASGAGMNFQAGGKYVTEDVDGSWKLAGQSLQLNDGREKLRGKLNAVSDHEFNVSWSDGDLSRYRRCFPGGSEPWFPAEMAKERDAKTFALASLTRRDWAALGAPPSCQFMADGKTLLITDGSTARVRYETGEDYEYRDETNSDGSGEHVFAMSIGTGIPPARIVIRPTHGGRSDPTGAPAALQMLAQGDYDSPVRVAWEKKGTLTCGVA